MFSKINDLEKMLIKLRDTLENTSSKKYTANQTLKIDDVNLHDSSVLNIHMTNTIMSSEVIGNCLDIVKELKMFFPMREGCGMRDALNNYENFLLVKALEKTDGHKRKASHLLGVTERTIKYLENKHIKNKEKNYEKDYRSW